MTGTVSSKELIECFGKHWIPFYQRERVMRAKKINSLIDVFKTGGKIDSIKLCLLGEYEYDPKAEVAVLDGKFIVIDGQQRLWALKESGATNLRIPVELFINICEEEQIALFHQFNRDQTKLCFGDLVKSTSGSFSEALRFLANPKRGELAIPLTTQTAKHSIGMALFCPVMFQVYMFIYKNLRLSSTNKGGKLLEFFSETYPKSEVAMTSFAMQNIMKITTDMFGTFDQKATVYRRPFFLAWCAVIINNFLMKTGKVELGKFESKIRDMPNRLGNNARIKELVRSGGDGVVVEIYNEIIDALNHKLHRGHLMRWSEVFAKGGETVSVPALSRYKTQQADMFN
jgi:hypothetical protein